MLCPTLKLSNFNITRVGETPFRVFPSCSFLPIGGNTMFENTSLSLNGYGHLYDIGHDKNGEVYIALHIINECKDSRADDLWIKCRVNMFNFPEIVEFEHYLAIESTIIVKFDAQYLSFNQCHSNMSENDPRLIVHLHGKLLKIHEYYIEKDNISSQFNHSIKKQIVSHSLRA